MLQTYDEIIGTQTRSQPDPITVLVIEQRQWMRDCICSCLSRNSGVIAVGISQLADAEGMVAQNKRSYVALVCMTGQPGCSELLDEILSACRLMPIIVLCDMINNSDIENLICAGVKGLVPAVLGWDTVVQAIRIIDSGGTVILERAVVAAPNGISAALDDGASLTARQRQVADCLRQGKSNKAIAFELHMQESTVKLHMKAIMKKLQAHNRTEAALRYSSSFAKASF